jgi:hypothetical protein
MTPTRIIGNLPRFAVPFAVPMPIVYAMPPVTANVVGNLPRSVVPFATVITVEENTSDLVVPAVPARRPAVPIRSPPVLVLDPAVPVPVLSEPEVNLIIDNGIVDNSEVLENIQYINDLDTIRINHIEYIQYEEFYNNVDDQFINRLNVDDQFNNNEPIEYAELIAPAVPPAPAAPAVPAAPARQRHDRTCHLFNPFRWFSP